MAPRTRAQTAPEAAEQSEDETSPEESPRAPEVPATGDIVAPGGEVVDGETVHGPAIELPLETAPLPEQTPVRPITTDGRWRGGILADEDFRVFVRLENVEHQEIARRISDLTLGATILNAMVIDAGFIPGLQGNGDVVWRAEMAAALAFGVTIATGDVVKRLVGRARPYERECAEHPDRAACDGGDDMFASFYSLHSGVAFSQAGFSCSMHLTRNLYRDVGADVTSCVVALALATTTAVLRMVADRHYLSDVSIGAAIGLVIGYLMPFAIVPEPAREPAAAETSSGLQTSALMGALQVHVDGEF